FGQAKRTEERLGRRTVQRLAVGNLALFRYWRVDRYPMPAHRNSTPESSCSLRCRETGFWAEHSGFFRNADRQNAQWASADGCRSSHNARKSRGDERADLDVSDNSASIPQNYLLVTASVQKADTEHDFPYSLNRSNPTPR